MLFAWFWTLKCFGVKLLCFLLMSPNDNWSHFSLHVIKAAQPFPPYSTAACHTASEPSCSLALPLCQHGVEIWAISIAALSSHSVNTMAPSGQIPLNTLQSLTALDREAWTEDWPSILKGWCFMGCQSSHRLCLLSLQRIQRQNEAWPPKDYYPYLLSRRISLVFYIFYTQQHLK